MGILRTDKISGLETPTAVTGSVAFDGNGDWITVAESEDFNFGTGDFTVEFWVYWNGGSVRGVQLTAAVTNGIWIGQVNTTDYVLRSYGNANHLTVSLPPLEKWHHIAVTRKNSTARFFVNGNLEASGSVTHNFVKHEIVIGSDESTGHMNGYMSNVRMLKGTALYTSNFTPPAHELEVIGDTVLLCCNNPDSVGAEGTGKTITSNGNPTPSTFSPGLSRDFTYGTEFRGVTTFDTQAYFVPPSGTTEQRGRGRGLFAIAGAQPASVNAISYIQISSEGNAQDFGDLSYAGNQATGVSSPTRAIFNNGNNPGDSDYSSTNVLDFVTIATTSNSADFGDLTTYRYGSAPLSNSTRGVFVGGLNEYTSPYPTGSAPTSYTNTMDYITMAALGNAVDFGDSISSASSHNSATSNSTRGVYTISFNGSSNDNSLYYITIATTGNGQDFGNLSYTNGNRQHRGVISNGTRGIFGGALVGSPAVNNIDFITIATLGNGQDFGDLSYARRSIGGTSNSIRGIFAGGYDAPPGPLGRINTIDYINIASTGDAQEFGDLIHRTTELAGASDSHGGIS